MKTKLLLIIATFALSVQLLGCGEREISFRADVQPIFQERCIECHDGAGEGVAASGFSVRDYASVMKGTTLGAVVIPGSSISSTLVLVIAQKTAPEIQMPPHHTEAWAEGRGSPLSEEDVGTIAAWIDEGAKDN